MTYLDRPFLAPPLVPYLLWQIARTLPRGHRVAVRSVGDREVMQATFLDGSIRCVDEIIAQAPVGPVGSSVPGNAWLRDFDQETLRRASALPGDRWGVVQIPKLARIGCDTEGEQDEQDEPILSITATLPDRQYLILGVESLGGVVRALAEIWGRHGYEAAVSSTSEEAFQRLTLRMIGERSSARTTAPLQ